MPCNGDICTPTAAMVDTAVGKLTAPCKGSGQSANPKLGPSLQDLSALLAKSKGYENFPQVFSDLHGYDLYGDIASLYVGIEGMDSNESYKVCEKLSTEIQAALRAAHQQVERKIPTICHMGQRVAVTKEFILLAAAKVREQQILIDNLTCQLRQKERQKREKDEIYADCTLKLNTQNEICKKRTATKRSNCKNKKKKSQCPSSLCPGSSKTLASQLSRLIQK